MTFIVLTILQLLGLALAAGVAIANIVKFKGVEEIKTPSLSRPFDKPKSGRIAIKVINHYGDEVMKVYEV